VRYNPTKSSYSSIKANGKYLKYFLIINLDTLLKIIYFDDNIKSVRNMLWLEV